MARMVDRYQDLLEVIFTAKVGRRETKDTTERETVLVTSSLLSSEG